MKLFLLIAVLGVTTLVPPAAAQSADPPKHEFRGAWIASVTNLDWPKTTNPAAQQTDLVRILDEFQASGINAVFFQIRPEVDAFYPSDTEPWSRWLTGAQGRAPEPFYDPLAFAIEEAHKRGMELHAWFNPYRVERQVGNYPLDPQNIASRHPEWTFTVGTYRQLDPGLPEVRDFVVEVVMDVVRRYNVDGVHFDDYFYPYPPNQISNQDDATFAAHPRGFTNRAAWRRDNVNLFVAQVNDSLQAVRPEVKHGISPFGIWRSGVPSGIVGLDAYSTIYADARAWLDAETIDYLVPQLYWAFGGGQDYGLLAPWWESVRNERHLYPGLGLYKADRSTFAGTLYNANEVPRQVRFNRAHEGIDGSVFFRAQNISDFNSLGITDSLRMNLYQHPALVPPMAWKDMTAPPAPGELSSEWDGEFLTLRWGRAAAAAGAADARFYAVYRIRSGAEPDYAAALADPRNLYLVTGDTLAVDRPRDAGEPYYYVVTSVSSNSIESAPTGAVVVEGRAVSAEPSGPAPVRLSQNYPNPFGDATVISFALEAPGAVTLRVYDVLGREVAVLVDEVLSPGTHTATLRADGLASGTYMYVLEQGGQRLGSQQMQVVR